VGARESAARKPAPSPNPARGRSPYAQEDLTAGSGSLRTRKVREKSTVVQRRDEVDPLGGDRESPAFQSSTAVAAPQMLGVLHPVADERARQPPGGQG